MEDSGTRLNLLYSVAITNVSTSALQELLDVVAKHGIKYVSIQSQYKEPAQAKPPTKQ